MNWLICLLLEHKSVFKFSWCAYSIQSDLKVENICFGVLNNFPLCRDCVCELSRKQSHQPTRAARVDFNQLQNAARVCCVVWARLSVCVHAATGFIICLGTVSAARQFWRECARGCRLVQFGRGEIRQFTRANDVWNGNFIMLCCLVVGFNERKVCFNFQPQTCLLA